MPGDLDRGHEVHVELDHHVCSALEKHHPLSDLLQIHVVRDAGDHEKNYLVEYCDGAEDKNGPKNHPLLEYEVGHDHDDDEPDEGALRESHEWPL